MSCHQAYRNSIARRVGILLAGVVVLLVLTVLDLASGSSGLTPGAVLSALMEGPDAGGMTGVIIWSIRLPMTMTALFVGTALALAGLEIQNITGNALASPSTLGITSAAGFGAAMAITLGLTVLGELWLGTSLAAFVSALAVSAAIYRLGCLRGMRPTTLILAGIVMNFFFMALQQVLQYRSSPEIAQVISGWTFGNLERSTWLSAAVAAMASAVCTALLAGKSWSLTALTVGEERAASLGVNVRRLRVQVFVLSALLVACAVGFIGTISFVGLVAPHCARLMLGEDQRFLLPGTLITGGVLMLASSVLAKCLSTGAMLPVGIITSLVGVPFLLILLLRDKGAMQ